MEKHHPPRCIALWWLRLITGIVELGFGFWVAGSFQRSAIVLVAFVGVATLFHGVTQIVLALQLRSLDPQRARAPLEGAAS